MSLFKRWKEILLSGPWQVFLDQEGLATKMNVNRRDLFMFKSVLTVMPPSYLKNKRQKLILTFIWV